MKGSILVIEDNEQNLYLVRFEVYVDQCCLEHAL